MPQIHTEKPTKEKPLAKDDPHKVVSAYSEDGQARIAKNKKRDRWILALGIVVFLGLLVGATLWMVLGSF